MDERVTLEIAEPSGYSTLAFPTGGDREAFMTAYRAKEAELGDNDYEGHDLFSWALNNYAEHGGQYLRFESMEDIEEASMERGEWQHDNALIGMEEVANALQVALPEVREYLSDWAMHGEEQARLRWVGEGQIVKEAQPLIERLKDATSLVNIARKANGQEDVTTLGDVFETIRAIKRDADWKPIPVSEQLEDRGEMAMAALVHALQAASPEVHDYLTDWILHGEEQARLRMILWSEEGQIVKDAQPLIKKLMYAQRCQESAINAHYGEGVVDAPTVDKVYAMARTAVVYVEHQRMYVEYQYHQPVPDRGRDQGDLDPFERLTARLTDRGAGQDTQPAPDRGRDR